MQSLKCETYNQEMTQYVHMYIYVYVIKGETYLFEIMK